MDFAAKKPRYLLRNAGQNGRNRIFSQPLRGCQKARRYSHAPLAAGAAAGNWTYPVRFCRITHLVRYSYPLLLDVSERLVVIVGGGGVALRKAQGLLAAGAGRVRCVALEFHTDFPDAVERIQAAFAPSHLEGADLVFAATDSPAVNEKVVEESRRRGIFVNRADGDEGLPGDFTTPALWRSCDVIIAVSAAGNPALAAKIRDDLAGKVDPMHVKMAEAMQILRPVILKSRGLTRPRRREALRELAGDEATKLLSDGGLPMLEVWLRERYPEIDMEDT
jgi:precorrin-2 dehydrogenase/sirohydrochlorin ferrochelatase